MDIKANLHQYITGNGENSGIGPEERYASFDYCFNYFQSFREQGKLADLVAADRLEQSCLQIGFYLASWGMLRGSGFLLAKSSKVYAPLVTAIAHANEVLWNIDVHCYTSSNIQLILDFRREINQTLPYSKKGPSDVLVTKIMLGVFGNVPAFDTYFRRGLGVSAFNRRGLERVCDFYQENQEIIEQYRLPTIDFITGKATPRRYSRAKVIDMVFFIEGSKTVRQDESLGLFVPDV